MSQRAFVNNRENDKRALDKGCTHKLIEGSFCRYYKISDNFVHRLISVYKADEPCKVDRLELVEYREKSALYHNMFLIVIGDNNQTRKKKVQHKPLFEKEEQSNQTCLTLRLAETQWSNRSGKRIDICAIKEATGLSDIQLIDFFILKSLSHT